MAKTLVARDAWPNRDPENHVDTGQTHVDADVQASVEEEHALMAYNGRSHAMVNGPDGRYRVAAPVVAGTYAHVATVCLTERMGIEGVILRYHVNSLHGCSLRVRCIETGAVATSAALAAGSQFGVLPLAIVRPDAVSTFEIWLSFAAGAGLPFSDLLWCEVYDADLGAAP